MSTESGRPIEFHVGMSAWIVMAIVYFAWYQAIGDEASGTAKFAIPLIPVVVFAGSILAHEIGHAVVMEANKIRVGKIALEAWGGYTKPEDDNFSLLQVPAAKYFSVSFAGPCVNLLVAIGLWLFALESPNLQELATQSNTIIDYSLVFAFKINLLMGILNLLPLFPLDGGHVLRSVLMGISGGSVVPGLVSGLFSLIVGSAYIRYIATTFLESGWEALRNVVAMYRM